MIKLNIIVILCLLLIACSPSDEGGAFNAQTTRVKQNDDLAQTGPHQDSLELIEAARDGNIQLLERQIANGVDFNYMDDNGLSAVHYAAWFNNVLALEKLESAGADLDTPCRNGSTPLNYAAFGNATDTGLFLIDSGVNVNTKHQSTGTTPLVRAAARGNLILVTALLDNGADPFIANNFGQTPVSVAQEYGHKEVAQKIQATMGSSSHSIDPTSAPASWGN